MLTWLRVVVRQSAAETLFRVRVGGVEKPMGGDFIRIGT